MRGGQTAPPTEHTQKGRYMQTLQDIDPEIVEGWKKRIVPEGTPVRFLHQGKALDILTGELHGGNIIYQPVYWDFPPDLARNIADTLGVKAVFSGPVTRVNQ